MQMASCRASWLINICSEGSASFAGKVSSNASLHSVSALAPVGLLPPQIIESPVADNRRHPGHRRGQAGFVVARVSPDIDERVLQNFFGPLTLHQYTKREAEQFRRSEVVERAQCGGVFARDAIQQLHERIGCRIAGEGCRHGTGRVGGDAIDLTEIVDTNRAGFFCIRMHPFRFYLRTNGYEPAFAAREFQWRNRARKAHPVSPFSSGPAGEMRLCPTIKAGHFFGYRYRFRSSSTPTALDSCKGLHAAFAAAFGGIFVGFCAIVDQPL